MEKKIFFLIIIQLLSFSVIAGDNCTNFVSAGLNCFTNGEASNANDVNRNFEIINNNVSAALTTELDPKIGILNNGKWCTSDGTKINCSNSDPTPVNIADNLGDHTASQNILLGTNWLSYDGNNNGISLSSGGIITTSSNLIVGNDLNVQEGVKIGSVGNPSTIDMYGEIELYNNSGTRYFNISSSSGNNDVVMNNPASGGSFRLSDELIMQYNTTSSWRDVSAGQFNVYGNGDGIDFNDSDGRRIGYISASGNANYETVRITADNSGKIELRDNIKVYGTASKPGGGAFTDSSDLRLKKNISAINNFDSLNIISNMEPVSYYWINPEEHGKNGHKKQVGFVAQQVSKIVPDWVIEIPAEGKDKKLIPEDKKAQGLSLPTAFNAHIVGAIKALVDEVNKLKEQNGELKKLVCSTHSNANICK